VRKRVLIIDDDPPIVRLIAGTLRKEKLTVAVASNGAEGLLAAAKHRPDLIILDIQMPVMDGMQMLRILRENVATKGIPVIILSIRAEDGDIVKGLAAGADMYIPKPFRVADLVSAVHRMLQVTGQQ
jgi:DNA-binding response OmpR family regulator